MNTKLKLVLILLFGIILFQSCNENLSTIEKDAKSYAEIECTLEKAIEKMLSNGGKINAEDYKPKLDKIKAKYEGTAENQKFLELVVKYKAKCK